MPTCKANLRHSVLSTTSTTNSWTSRRTASRCPAWRPRGSMVDPVTWRFTLRKGVTFHNGEAFNARAVKFSFDRIVDPNQKAPLQTRLFGIKEVKVIDDFTIDMVTKEPYAPSLYIISMFVHRPARHGQADGRHEVRAVWDRDRPLPRREVGEGPRARARGQPEVLEGRTPGPARGVPADPGGLGARRGAPDGGVRHHHGRPPRPLEGHPREQSHPPCGPQAGSSYTWVSTPSTRPSTTCASAAL